MSLNVQRLIVSPFQTNCYILWCERENQAMVIDPGGSGHKIVRLLKKAGADLRHIILTHGHFDHIARSRFIQGKTRARAVGHPADIRKMSLSGLILARLKVDEVKGGEEIPFCGKTMRVLHTPGHSPGSISLLLDDMLFCGDLLFAGGVGRWDLPRGSLDELLKSLHERIKHLPDSTRVLPGHGPETSLGVERKTNPVFRPEFDGTF